MSSEGYTDTHLLIDGVWRTAGSRESLPVHNPATGEEIGRVSKAGRDDLDAALAAAERGFALWRHVPAFDRYKLMRKAAGLIRERAPAIARVMTIEQGKPLAEALIETQNAGDLIDWFAEEGRRAYGASIPSRARGIDQRTIRVPIGPVAAFTPWNFPINQAVRKIAGALASGCSIVLKGPEETPASCAALAQAFVDAGLPAGVLNLVFGVPAEISTHLIADPIIRKVSFTGSTVVGKHLAALAGSHMKPVTMELGGHAPALVCEDAGVEGAVSLLAAAKFRNAGQVCIAPTRFLVHAAVWDRFLDGFSDAARAVKVGNGLEPETRMGPLAHARRVTAMEDLVADAVRSGADLVAGGGRGANQGFFFEPTVLANVPLSARIMSEEPFGPVALVNRFEDEDAMIAEANRLRYGLAAYAYTGSAGRANRIGHALDAGMVSINHHGLGLPETPFGGIGDSGYGTEGGADALDAYLVTKFVSYNEAA